MHYTIISGSHRPEKQAQSYKITQWLAEELDNSNQQNTTDIISLSGNPYPLWDISAWQEGSELLARLSPELEKLENADGLILVCPEYHGTASPALKNFLLYVSSLHVAHKPCLLVGVSASSGGTYPIAELRIGGAKNNRMVYVPDHLIIRNAEKVMNDHDMQGEEGSEDLYIKKRALYSLNILQAYTRALKDMREQNTLLDKDYPFGM